MRAQEFISERETVPFQGIDISVEREEDEIMVRASAGGRPLGSVLFVDYDGELMPQDLEVDERYRGQGIAAAMYDYVKSQGYRIRRSGQQTDAGAGFWDKHKPGKNVWEQGVAEGLSEARNSLFAFVKQQFPTWPDYVLKDFLYQQAKGIRDQAELDDFLKRNKQDFGNCKWTLTKLPITFDIFTPKTQRMLASREGGSSNPFQVPRDAERHAQQSQMIQQKGVSAEPIIVAKLSNGYDLIEGWHRTIQHLKAFPQGYTGPAWVCTGATYKSESVEQGVAEGPFNKCFDKACKLYDKAVEKDLNPILYQVADYKGDGSDADSRWAKLQQHVWSHYVTVIGDTVYDPTAKQFGPDKSEKYNINQLEKEWGKIYKIRPKQQGVREGLDPYRLERLDPQTRRVLTRMADHKEPGSWLSASEAYAMMLGLQYKNRDPRGWEQDVQRYVDLYRQYSGQGISEVKILSRVKGKGSEPGQLPRFGRPIGPGEETRYLGTKVADWQGREIWRDYLGGQLSYHLFDPDTRTVIVTTFGSRYKNNPRSYIIHGLYAAPGNPVRAAEFYRGLVRDLGLTLISDRKQSPGGNRVWQQLEQFPDVEVYGYDTNTDQALNFGASDVEMYTVPSAAVAGSREMQRVARDLRLVATAR